MDGYFDTLDQNGSVINTDGGDHENRRNIDQTWSMEAEQRIQELDEGLVEGIPGEQIFKEIRIRLKENKFP